MKFKEFLLESIYRNLTEAETIQIVQQLFEVKIHPQDFNYMRVYGTNLNCNRTGTDYRVNVDVYLPKDFQERYRLKLPTNEEKSKNNISLTFDPDVGKYCYIDEQGELKNAQIRTDYDGETERTYITTYKNKEDEDGVKHYLDEPLPEGIYPTMNIDLTMYKMNDLIKFVPPELEYQQVEIPLEFGDE